MRIYFWIFKSIPLVYMSILMPVLHSLIILKFVVSFKIAKYEFFDFVVLFQDCFGYLGIPCKSLPILKSLAISVKKEKEKKKKKKKSKPH